MKLTKVNIAKVAVPSGKSEIIEFDDDVPGFGLRVRAGGSATWIFQYRQGNKTTPPFARLGSGDHRTQRP